MSQPAPFQVENSDAPALYEALVGIGRAGYCEAAVCSRLGIEDITNLNWRELPGYRDERLILRDSLTLAIDLFLLQGALPVAELERLLPAMSRDVLLRTGILGIDEEGIVRARASLYPVGTRLVFSDHAWPELPHPRYAATPYNHVMAVGVDSRQLAHATVRRPVQLALDLCTGSGVHALLASGQAERVVAVDINPRAVLCSRFNAHALGITNLETIEGDLFEPIGDQHFDLITANPPFVPSPVSAVLFRDGGPAGEDIQKRIVAGLPHHLAPGGIAQLVTELGERDSVPITCQLREWLGDAPTDIYVLRLARYTPAQYAIGHAKGSDYGTFLDSAGAWARNLREQRFTSIVSVLIAFQWSSPECGPPWQRIDECPSPKRSAGVEIEETFVAERLARQPILRGLLEGKRLRRSDPIARFDSAVLGTQGIPTKSRASRLGRALTIEYDLDTVEHQLLDGMNGHIEATELFSLCRESHVDEALALDAIRSLLRKGLIAID